MALSYGTSYGAGRICAIVLADIGVQWLANASHCYIKTRLDTE